MALTDVEIAQGRELLRLRNEDLIDVAGAESRWQTWISRHAVALLTATDEFKERATYLRGLQDAKVALDRGGVGDDTLAKGSIDSALTEVADISFIPHFQLIHLRKHRAKSEGVEQIMAQSIPAARKLEEIDRLYNPPE